MKQRKPFKFKQFTIEQNLVTLPVTTDACIFGGFCSFSQPQNILDIGAGTGLLALMMSQKYPNSKITAIEKHPETAFQAKINCESNRINNIEIIEHDIFTYKPDVKFEAIISNPPFFTNQLESETDLKNQARHFSNHNFSDFFQCIENLLDKNGSAWILLPYSALDSISHDIQATNLKIKRLIALCPNEAKNKHLLFVNLDFNACKIPPIETYAVKNSENNFTPDVYKWLEPFYLEQALNL